MTHSARLLLMVIAAFAAAGTHEVKSTRKPVALPTGPHAAHGRPELSPAPAGLMIPGSVERIQRVLGQQGLLREHKDGELDEATSAAIRQFQGNRGLAKTGVPDHETVRQLGLDPDSVFKPPVQ